MTKKTGKLYLISIGPGHADHLTVRALEAIREAEVVVGYKTYLNLVASLLGGKKIVASAMRQEVDRCAEACRMAIAGKRVALISSGDVGVYGMAGLAYEILLHAGWRPDSGVAVEVVPGVTALSACAALVGAPLTHDFCAISLSDLLTDWHVIEKRLEAAARADFVTALYNPKSSKRTFQIFQAQRIFLSHRSADTPVAVVTAAFREQERIVLTDLAHMTAPDIGMQTTVLIGSSRSYIHANVMVTPRGYGSKYEMNRVLDDY